MLPSLINTDDGCRLVVCGNGVHLLFLSYLRGKVKEAELGLPPVTDRLLVNYIVFFSFLAK